MILNGDNGKQRVTKDCNAVSMPPHWPGGLAGLGPSVSRVWDGTEELCF